MDNMEEEIIEVNNQYKLYDTGIEDEPEEETEMDPFDPEQISIESKIVPMETLLRRLLQGTIILNPDFQRAEVWTAEKKSQLIESIMLKIPLPMFYVSADEKNNYTVVDGLQRLSTIRSFVLGDRFLEDKIEAHRGSGFTLQDMEFWKSYNKSDFNGLPNNIKNRILETELRFTIINPGTPEEVRRNIFKRLNTGGMALSSQEIRNALYLGQSTRLLNELAAYDEFKKATANSIKSLRMEDKELILRFLSFLIRDYNSYKKTFSIDKYLSDTMIILNAFPGLNSKDFLKGIKNESFDVSDIKLMSLDAIKEKFSIAMIRSHKIFGRHTFRKSFGDNYRTAINKSLFETWGVLMANLSDQQFQKLLENKDAFLDSYIPVIVDAGFQRIISRDSMKAPSVKMRFEKFDQLIKKYSE